MGNMQGLVENVWVITIVGGAIATLIASFIYKIFARETPNVSNEQNDSNANTQTTNVSNVINIAQHDPVENVPANTEGKTVNVLFIDDDVRFKIVDILKKYSWIKCSIVKDVTDLQVSQVKEADIVFVDIEDVGKKLWPEEQGLGVVVDMNRLYPEKHIVIYSSSTKRNMTHPAFRVATGVLSKDAQPSEFLRYIQDVRNEI